MTPQFLEIMEREQGSLSTEQRDTSLLQGLIGQRMFLGIPDVTQSAHLPGKRPPQEIWCNENQTPDRRF